MFEKIFVFANEAGAAAELIEGARGLGGRVYLVSCSDISGADELYSYSADCSVATVLPQIAEVIKKQAPELVLCDSSRDGRLVAGYVGATLLTSPISDVMSLDCSDNSVTATHLVYGGSAVKTETCALPCVVVASSGVFETQGLQSDCECVKHELACGTVGLELVSVSSAEASTLNLAAAKRVLGIGRGLSSADNIPAAERLAAVLGAEIGCTRPVAEEEHWYGKERYIGVSGCMLKPNFYLALGISGQIQHMVGVNQSGVVFSIDKNENAPIVGQSDYCLIGDIATVLPTLIEKLGG